MNTGLCGLVPVEPPPDQPWENQEVGCGLLQVQTYPTDMSEDPGSKHCYNGLT